MNEVAAGPRRLVVVAVDEYLAADEGFAAGIRKQVETITGWLAAPSLDAERRFEVAQPKELIEAQDLRAFLAEQALVRAGWDEALVVYVTGHGLRGHSRRHYLTFGLTDEDRLLGTAFPTSELITQVMDSEAEHVLVLIDSCFAGSLKSELAILFEELCDQRRQLRTLAVITSGDFTQEPRLGEFTQVLQLALDKARDESAGFTAPYLSFEEWEKLLNTVGDENPGLLRALWVWPDSRRTEPSLCLPNPHYQPQEKIVEAARQPVSLSASVLEQYWLARASGRTHDSDPGWYFSGRQALMQVLVDFVHAGEGVLVVTGAAGSGKSALLARLVTLSDPLFATTSRFADILYAVPSHLRPVQGAVDAAVVAREKSPLTVIEDLLAAFDVSVGRDEPPLQVLLNHLIARRTAAGMPVTVVIDGLDEAQQPTACLSDVIGPLARLRTADNETAVRLVLGMRSSAQDDVGGKLQDAPADQLLGFLRAALQPGVHEEQVELMHLRTDGAQTAEDITAYVQAVLQTQEDRPYTLQDREAARAAAVIANAVTPSFLDAQLAAAQLRRAASVQDLDDIEWRSRLQAGTTALLGNDLRQVARDEGVDLRVLVSVLRATAFAQGTGLPWAEVWPAVTSAVLGPDAPVPLEEIDTAIRIVRHSRLVGYLTTGEEDGRVTYRPTHQRVAEVLRAKPASLVFDPSHDDVTDLAVLVDDTRTPLEIHAAIAQACARLARIAGHLAPHPYVQRYTVAHAEAGRVLDDAVMPLELAARESSETLRARLGLPLPAGDSSRRILTAAGMIEPYLNDRVDVPSRLGSIRFHLAALDTAHGRSKAPVFDTPPVEPAPLSLAPVRVHWRSRTNVVASPRRHVRALRALRTLDGRNLIATATQHGIGVWSVASGQQLIHIDSGAVSALTVAQGTSGRPFLVAAITDGAAVFDPLSGHRLASLHLPGARAVSVLHDGPDRWQMAVRTPDSMTLWQPSEDRSRTVELPGELKLVKQMPWVRGEGRRRYRLCKWRGGGWALFDPLLGEVVEVEMPVSGVRSAAAVDGPHGGDLLVVAGGHNTPVVLFDPFNQGNVASLTERGEQVIPLRAGSERDVVGIVSDGAVQVWKVSGQRPLHVAQFASQPRRLMTAISGENGSWKLAFASDEGVLIQRGHAPVRDKASRVTAPGTGIAPGAAHMMCMGVSSGGNERLVVASGNTVHMLGSADGRRVHRYKRQSAVLSVETVPGHGDGLVVAVAHKDGIDLWDTELSTRQQPAVKGLSTWMGNSRWCAVRFPQGDPGVVMATRSGVHAVNIVTGHTTVLPLSSTRATRALLALPSPQGSCLVAGAPVGELTVWDVALEQVVCKFALHRRSRVSALCTVPLADGRLAVAAATAHDITLWDAAGGTQPLSRFDTPGTNTMCVVPQQQGPSLLATGNGIGVRLWEPMTGQLVHSLLTAAPVTNLAHTTLGEPRLFVGGPAGLASLSWLPAAALR